MDLTLKPEDTLLLVVDIQERLAPAMDARLFERLLKNMQRLGAAAKLLGVPVLMTEQYPKGLGPTLAAVKQDVPDARILEKTCFDAAKDDAVAQAIIESGRRKILVTGIETHVCVYQSVRSLASRYTVHLLKDAVASRTPENYEVGVELARAAGGIVTSTEVVLFDLVQRAGTEQFRTISKLVR